MTDQEKVIKELEAVLDWLYQGEDRGALQAYKAVEDALDLLREQNETAAGGKTMTFGELFMKMNPDIIVKANGHCMWIYPEYCNGNGLYYPFLKEWWNQNINIDTEKLNSIKPSIGNDDNYYCSKCGVKITNAMKIYDGERYMTEHPDHLKPVHKWEYCKHCGHPIDWGLM